MAEIFVVTAGSYSDYSLLAVCATEELAKAWVQGKLSEPDPKPPGGHMRGPWWRDDWEIETWDLVQSRDELEAAMPWLRELTP